MSKLSKYDYIPMDLQVGQHYVLSGGGLVRLNAIELDSNFLQCSFWSPKGYWRNLQIDQAFLLGCNPQYRTDAQAEMLKTLICNKL
jgi:hypothetical protein